MWCLWPAYVKIFETWKPWGHVRNDLLTFPVKLQLQTLQCNLSMMSLKFKQFIFIVFMQKDKTSLFILKYFSWLVMMCSSMCTSCTAQPMSWYWLEVSKTKNKPTMSSTQILLIPVIDSVHKRNKIQAFYVIFHMLQNLMLLWFGLQPRIC